MTQPSVLREDPLTEDGSDFLAIDPLVVCPQGMFTKAKDMNASTANLFNILKKGLWKWTEDEDPIDNQPNAREDQNKPNWQETEDCLVLNINTPKIPADGEELKMPVIFFIHGGSSTQVWGAPFMGHKFMKHDVVLVTINYRLGVLGALNLGIDDAPGNAAMYDTLTALDWVHKYIHHFGGDKDRIVVYGHSAGSMMASMLLFSPLAEGKFTGVIGASGSALATWGTAEYNSLKHHLEVCFLAGCYPEFVEGEEPAENTDYNAIYACMRDTEEGVLRQALSRYSNKHQKAGGLGFDAKVPSVQHSPLITIPKFLEEMPAEILMKGKQNPANLIMGATRHDGSFAFEDVYKKYLVENNLVDDVDFMKNDLLNQMIKIMKATDKSGAFQHIVGKTYFGDAMKNGKFEEMLPGLIDLTSVWGFKAPAWELVEKHASVNPNSFYYAFDFAGFWSTCDMGGESEIPCGVPHIDDMSFTFQIFPIINEDYQVAERLVKYFVNFAYNGTPNNGSELLFWEPYDPMTHPFLKIDATDSIGYECRDSWIDNALEIV
ncbi:Acetylcholinesterase-1 [Folsomia candida]|uniref:Carboxylic ester hydrolase n=1 Tax=Folsomia candida TaxID=158441 RepID=A0A226EQ44_FOLCA|nr:Acetylcholinesterase-1 [Folsomia candida]